MRVPVDPWSAAQRELAAAIQTILDDATVAWLTLTSSPDARARAQREERSNVPAYDVAPRSSPCDRVTWCANCGVRFWARVLGPQRRYCSPRCNKQDYWLRMTPAARERSRARVRDRWADPEWRVRENARLRRDKR